MAEEKNNRNTPKGNIIRGEGEDSSYIPNSFWKEFSYWQGRQSSKMESSGPSDRREPEVKVEIEDVSDDVLRKLNITPSEDINQVVASTQETGGLLERLLKIAGPLLLSGAGLFGSLAAMASGGSTQGLFNLISKGLLFVFDSILMKLPGMSFLTTHAEEILKGIFEGGDGFIKSILTKLFGKGGGVITKVIGTRGASMLTRGLGLVSEAFLKRLPIIGSLISMYSGIQRMNEGDFLGGIVDFGAAVAYMFPGFPGIGTAIGIALDVLNATMDISEAKGEDAGGFMGWLAGVKNGANEWIAKNAKNLPVIGMFVRLYDAFNNYENVPKLLKDLMAAGLVSIPGLPFLINWMTGSDEGLETFTSAVVDGDIDFLGIVKSVRDWIVEWLSGLLEKGIKSGVSSLYDLFPNPAVDKLLETLGIGWMSFEQEGEDRILFTPNPNANGVRRRNRNSLSVEIPSTTPVKLSPEEIARKKQMEEQGNLAIEGLIRQLEQNNRLLAETYGQQSTLAQQINNRSSVSYNFSTPSAGAKEIRHNHTLSKLGLATQ